MTRASSSESHTPVHAGLLAVLAVGEQRLAEPALVVRDEVSGGGEDMPRRAIIALQPHDLRAGKILLEAQDVIDLRAAPAVDRLVVVADAADVALRTIGACLREQPQPQILDRVRVLVLVDEHIAEAPLIFGEHVRIVAQQAQTFEQQVAEIRRVQRLQPLLIELRRCAGPCRWRTPRPRQRARARAPARGSSSRPS